MYPVLFEIGSVKLYSYGAMIALGVLVSVLMNYFLCNIAKIDFDKYFNMILTILFTSILGSRGLYVLLNLHQFKDKPMSVFKLSDGGMYFFGAFILGFIVLIVFSKIYKMDLMTVFDIAMITTAFAHIFGRLGCFFRGCCHGVTSHNYGIIFPHIRENTIPKIPTQLYSSFFIFLIAMFLFLNFIFKIGKINKMKPKRYKELKESGKLGIFSLKGAYFSFYFMLYGLFRIIIHIFRDNPAHEVYYGVSFDQWIGILLIAIGVSFLAVMKKRKNYYEASVEK